MTVQSAHRPFPHARVLSPIQEWIPNPFSKACRASLMALLLALPFSASAQSADTDGDGIIDDRDNCVQVYNPNQHDDDQDLYGDVCDPDLNNDGAVDSSDIAEFKRLMGTGDLEPDLSGDGQVDYRDLGLLKSMLGGAPGPRGVTAVEIDPDDRDRIFHIEDGPKRSDCDRIESLHRFSLLPLIEESPRSPRETRRLVEGSGTSVQPAATGSKPVPAKLVFMS